jgi:hypothetical protein
MSSQSISCVEKNLSRDLDELVTREMNASQITDFCERSFVLSDIVNQTLSKGKVEMAERVARKIPDPLLMGSALSHIASSCVDFAIEKANREKGDEDLISPIDISFAIENAKRVADSISDPASRCEALIGIAKSVPSFPFRIYYGADRERFLSEAEMIAKQIDNPLSKLQCLTLIVANTNDVDQIERIFSVAKKVLPETEKYALQRDDDCTKSLSLKGVVDFYKTMDKRNALLDFAFYNTIDGRDQILRVVHLMPHSDTRSHLLSDLFRFYISSSMESKSFAFKIFDEIPFSEIRKDREISICALEMLRK